MKLERLLEVSFERCGINRETPLLVGVSGGPDSLCLLDGLARLQFSLVAAHFDHSLRPESARDADTVRETAARLGIPFVTSRQDVSAYALRERISIEEAARALRYKFLFQEARRVSAQAVAVGHTADDQVETVLMHLLRGAGLSGLAGMPFRGLFPDWDARIPLVRPLLPFWREETLVYCQEYGLQPVFDPSNQDTTFFRNRLRHELIPLLETYNPQVRQSIWRTSQILSGDESIVEAALQAAWEHCFAGQGIGAVKLRLEPFTALLPGLQRAVLRKAVSQLHPSLRDIDFDAVERGLRWASAPGSGQIDLSQGLRLFVEAGLLWIVSPDWQPEVGAYPQIAQAQMDLPVPGEVMLAPGWRLVSEWLEGFMPARLPVNLPSPWHAWLDGDTLPGPLIVRRPRPGDRFQPLGMQGHMVKLSDFWINHKIPRSTRQAWPLVACADTIVWVPGLRPAHPFRVREDTRRILTLRVFRE